MLHIHQLTITSPTQTVLSNVSLSLSQGETMAIVGESGSGKSTLLKCLIGLPLGDLKHTSGSISFYQYSISPSNKRESLPFLGTEIAWITQHANLSFNNNRTIQAHYNDLKRTFQRKKNLRTLEECLTLVGFAHANEIAKKYPFELSGGMMQRVAIALALIAYPSLIIADEPTSALDVVTKHQLVHLLKRLHQTEKTALLFVTHDISLASELSSRLVVMKSGEIVEAGDTESILNNPQHPYTQLLLHSIPTL